ncbi:hypothetical protein GGI12_002421 [Dipsacomyces acuminosporus]|nr:hypothetical protein GGI12_002421 [Dipsacomyces acuminosporus]
MRLSLALFDSHKVLTVPLNAIGLRADRFILNKVSIPPNLLFKLLRKRAIAEIDVDGRYKKINGADRVFPGMRIRVPDNLVTDLSSDANAAVTRSPQTNSKRAEFIKRQLPVLMDTDAMAVFQKPAGLPCQGGSKVQYSIDMFLAELDQIRGYDRDGDTGYRLVHRLDRGTTGALVVAKTRLAAKTLAKAFHDRTVKKTYIAVLDGIPNSLQGAVDAPLVNTGASVDVVRDRALQEGKPALTKYKVLKTGVFENKKLSLVEVDILTGRKHQIRVHCARVLGCPILGDHKYADSDNDDAPDQDNIYLHLFKLQVPDVDKLGNTKQTEASPDSLVSVKAPFPEFWMPVFKSLGVSFTKRG